MNPNCELYARFLIPATAETNPNANPIDVVGGEGSDKPCPAISTNTGQPCMQPPQFTWFTTFLLSMHPSVFLTEGVSACQENRGMPKECFPDRGRVRMSGKQGDAKGVFS